MDEWLDEALACTACGNAADHERVYLRAVGDYEDEIDAADRVHIFYDAACCEETGLGAMEMQPQAHHSRKAQMTWHLEEEAPSQPSLGFQDAPGGSLQTGRQQSPRERTPVKGERTSSPRPTPPRILSKEDRVSESTERFSFCLRKFFSLLLPSLMLTSWHPLATGKQEYTNSDEGERRNQGGPGKVSAAPH